MSQGGANTSSGSGGNPIETLTGNSGGAVGPDGAFNIDVLGNNASGIDIVGTPASNLLTVIGLQASTTQRGTTEYATAIETGQLTDSTRTITPAGLEPILVTPYVVATGGAYTTIQSAVDAANAAGGGTVYIRDGSYTEDLTLYDSVNLNGVGSVTINGSHTPPATGSIICDNITFSDNDSIFLNNAMTTFNLTCNNCFFSIDSGYIIEGTNWGGNLTLFNCEDASGSNDNGIASGTDFPTCTILYCSTIGAGLGNSLSTQGDMFCQYSDINCAIDTAAGNHTFVDCSFLRSNQFTGSASAIFRHCKFNTGFFPLSGPSVTTTSSQTIQLVSCIINSDNAQVLQGTGTFDLWDISYIQNTGVAGTLTINQEITEVGNLYAQNISFDRGTTLVDTDGQLIIGSTGNNPQIATLTAGANISITNGAGSITIAANGGGSLDITAIDNTDSPYTVLSTDEYLSCDVSGGILTIELPDAPSTGRVIRIKDSGGDAATNNISVTTVGGAVTIDGVTTYTMNTNYQAISVIFNGTSYEIF